MDIACDPELVKLAISLTSLPVNSYLQKAILIAHFKILHYGKDAKDSNYFLSSHIFYFIEMDLDKQQF